MEVGTHGRLTQSGKPYCSLQLARRWLPRMVLATSIFFQSGTALANQCKVAEVRVKNALPPCVGFGNAAGSLCWLM